MPEERAVGVARRPAQLTRLLRPGSVHGVARGRVVLRRSRQATPTATIVDVHPHRISGQRLTPGALRIGEVKSLPVAHRRCARNRPEAPVLALVRHRYASVALARRRGWEIPSGDSDLDSRCY